MASSLIIRGEHGIKFVPWSSQITTEMLPKSHTAEKCVFVKPVIHSPIIELSGIRYVARRDDTCFQ